MSGHGPEEKRLSPVVAVIAIIATAAIAFLVGYFVARPPSLQDIPDSSAELAKATIDSEALPVVGSPAKGEHTAPLTIVEFGDFQCNACRGASEAIVNRAMREYGPDNVRVVWKNLPLATHPDARLAAQATAAAQMQGKFWEYHDVLFSNFPTDRKAADFNERVTTFLKEDKLVAYASDLNLDVQKFKTDMHSDAVKQMVGRDTELASRLGLQSTPTFYVNGRKVAFNRGQVDFQSVKVLLDQEMAKSQKLLETPNAFYAFAVHSNSKLADGIQLEKTVATGSEAMADALGGEGARRGKGAAKGDAPAAAKQGEKPAARKKPPARVLTPGLSPSATGPDPATLPGKGAKNPKVQIVEFSDFQCGFCGRVNKTLDQIMKKYPNDVRITFAQFPLDFHADAPLAAQATLAAHEQGKFWEYHDLCFANQRSLKRPDLEKFAEQLGLNMPKFKQALDTKKYVKVMDQHVVDGRKFGLTGTPSFLINGRKFVGAQPIENFTKIIDEEIKRHDKVAKEKGLKGLALYKELVKTAPKDAPPPKKKQPEDTGRHAVDFGKSAVLGNPDALVTVVEFTDFECPFCSRGSNTVHELLKKNPDKMKLVFKHYPLHFHKKAPLAHRASIAAGNQGKFWEYHDKLFGNQKKIDKPDLVRYAQELGLNMAKFNADLENAALDAVVKADQAAGNKVGVRGTPHFFINGTRFSGAQPLPNFQAALDREHKLAEEYLKKGVAKDKLLETIIKEENKKTPPPVKVDIKGSPFKGPANAAVTILEFSDFQCGFCKKVNPTLAELVKAYPNDVKIVFKHNPLPMHSDAGLAAEASMAAHEQGKFWEYHDLCFANMRALKRENLDAYAEQLGLNMTKFKQALDTRKYKKFVENDTAQGKANGISGTPSFLINGKKFVGAQPIDAFKGEVEAALKAKK